MNKINENPNEEKKAVNENVKARLKGAVSKIGVMRAFNLKRKNTPTPVPIVPVKPSRDNVKLQIEKVEGVTKNDVDEFMTKWNNSKNQTPVTVWNILNQASKRVRQRKENKERENAVKGLVGGAITKVVKNKERENAVKGLVGGAITKVVKNKERENAVGKISTLESLKKAGAKPIYNNSNSNTENNIKPKKTVINKEPKVIKNPLFENKPFNASEELNKQLNIKGKELNKANTKKKIRNGVEFKIKQIEGLTNEDVKEFMTKWNNTKNPFSRPKIFNQARKRGKGRLAGATKTKERTKPTVNDENAATEATKLFNVSSGVKDLTRGEEERDVNKNILNRTRKLVGFGIGGKSREKFLARGRGMQNTRPLVKELDERLTLINAVKNLPNRKQLEKNIRNSGTTIDRVRILVKASQNKQNREGAGKGLLNNAIDKAILKKNVRKPTPLGGRAAEKPPTRSFKATVKNMKAQKVMNAVKSAAEIARNQKKLAEATGAQKVQLAKQQRAAMNRNKGKNASTAASLLKTRNNKFIKKGISSQAALKAEEKRVKILAKKAEEAAKTQAILKAQKIKAQALKVEKASTSTQKKGQMTRKSNPKKGKK
jgi:hypothetical protein